MRSVLIGFEYPVTGTPHFLFPILYRNLCRGVADSYALSRFHDDVSLRDLLAVRHFKGTDTVIVNNNPLIGDAVPFFRMVHVDMVNQLGHHTLGNFRNMSIAPYHLQIVLHIHLLSFGLFQFQPQGFDLCADLALLLLVSL